MGEPAFWGPFIPILPLWREPWAWHALREVCGSMPHDTWLPMKCFMCKCWPGQFRCIPQWFLPGCDEHLITAGTPELMLSACAFLLPGIFLAIQLLTHICNQHLSCKFHDRKRLSLQWPNWEMMMLVVLKEWIHFPMVSNISLKYQLLSSALPSPKNYFKIVSHVLCRTSVFLIHVFLARFIKSFL